MKVLDGSGTMTLGSTLDAWAQKGPEELLVMSPFVSEAAARQLAKAVNKVVKRKGTARILAGTKQSFTDPAALDLFHKLEKAIEKVEVRTDFNLPFDKRFHAKLFAARWKTGKTSFAVGSSNLTVAGLSGKGELALVIQLVEDAASCQELIQFFEHWFSLGESVAQTARDYASRRTFTGQDVGRKAPRLLELVRAGAVGLTTASRDWTEEEMKEMKESAAQLEAAHGGKGFVDAMESNRYEPWGVWQGQFRRGDVVMAVFRPLKPDCTLDVYELMSDPFPLSWAAPKKDEWVALLRKKRFRGLRRKRVRPVLLSTHWKTHSELWRRLEGDEKWQPTAKQLESLCRLVFPELGENQN